MPHTGVSRCCWERPPWPTWPMPQDCLTSPMRCYGVRFAMVAELAQPALLLYVGLAFLSPVERSHDCSVRWRARVIGILGLLLAVCAVTGQVFERKVFEDGQVAIILASWGGLPYVFILTGMALGLAQLELVLRASREPVRHKLKFIVIGLGGLAGLPNLSSQPDAPISSLAS